MRYIWINPVAEKMYGKDIDRVKDDLKINQYKIVNCDSQLDNVRNEYKLLSGKSNKTILDCRCPETITLLRNNNLTNNFEVSEIDPILVRTSKVLYKENIKSNEDILIITCPCTQLRNHTRNVFKDIKNIEIYTWKEFAESQGIDSLGKIDKSPIPLGFYRKGFNKVLEISGEDEILESVSKVENNKYEVIEMLYCKDGCNNGDGL